MNSNPIMPLIPFYSSNHKKPKIPKKVPFIIMFVHSLPFSYHSPIFNSSNSSPGSIVTHGPLAAKFSIFSGSFLNSSFNSSL